MHLSLRASLIHSLGLDGQKRYEQLVGSLNYAAHTTRIDIAHAVNQLSRASRSPRARHLAAAERVLRYLVGTATPGSAFHTACWPDFGVLR